MKYLLAIFSATVPKYHVGIISLSHGVLPVEVHNWCGSLVVHCQVERAQPVEKNA